MRAFFLWISIICLGYYVYVTGKEQLSQYYDNRSFDQEVLTFPHHPTHRQILGKIEIDRLHLSAIVREGVDAKTLSTSVGHIPSTSLPGHAGNFALAAHRDRLFRALKDIKTDDLVTFQSPDHTYTYRVENTQVVKPTDVAVLRPDGHEELTLITCYPFYYIGSAPERFIVKARLVGQIAQ